MSRESDPQNGNMVVERNTRNNRWSVLGSCWNAEDGRQSAHWKEGGDGRAEMASDTQLELRID